VEKQGSKLRDSKFENKNICDEKLSGKDGINSYSATISLGFKTKLSLNSFVCQ
jgi:hypothetical protein